MLLPVALHRERVAALVRRRDPQLRPMADVAGLVLAEDVRAPIQLPPFDNSAMDGYAVRAADIATATTAAPVVLPVAQDIPAGLIDVAPLAPGTAHRIMTGAPMPSGADTVVQVEATDGGVETVEVHEPRAVGTHVRRAGEDVALGDLVLSAGTVLGSAQIGLLAALGVAQASVVPPLLVLVLSTGSELVSPGEQLQPGQIYESNAPMLAAAIRAAGAEAEVLRFVADDVAAFRAGLDARLADRSRPSVDLIVTTGGVSAGAYEVVKDALGDEAVEFVRVAMQPGMPQGAGHYGSTPIVTFPGNPVSALVSFEVFLRPALRAALEHTVTARPTVTARLVEALDAPAGKRQYRRGRYEAGTVTLIGPPGSHFLRSLAWSNCLIDIGEDVTHLDAGSDVTVWLLDEA